MTYADLELALRRWSAAADDPGYAAEVRFEVAASRAVARSIDGPPPRVLLDFAALDQLVDDPRAYGQRLTAMLFADARLREILALARGQAQAQQLALRLRLRLDAADDRIHSLRWETLQDPDRGDVLCASENLLVSRYLDSQDMAPVRARPRADLKALVAVASPADLEKYQLAPVDIAGEVARCRAALAEIPTTVLAHGYGERATLNGIAAALRDAPDILYLVCHGTLKDGRPYLWLEDEAGAIGRVAGAELVACLERLEQRPALIVLASCQSAGHSHAAGALAALGPRLAAAGIAAVVAMQGDISMATVATFMPTFFRELRRDGRIDRALAAARAGVLSRPDWWMPVLFLRVRDGLLWSEPELPAPPEPERPPQLVDFVGRQAELEAFARQLASERLVVITGMPGVGKTALATELAGRVAPPDKIFWHTFHEDEGVDVIIWKLAGFLARNQQEDLWRMLESARRTGGQPPPEVLLDYLIQLLHGRGYMLCLDDFHFVADDPLLDQLVARLRAETHDGTTALLITSRQMPVFAQEEAMALEGMSVGDIKLLLVARGLDLPPELVAELCAYTGGNAQIVTLAIDRLLRSRDPAALIARLSEVDNIERYLMAEVDADLSEEQRAAMSAVAALLGYGGTRAAIEAVLDRGGLRPTLRGLCDRYLLTMTEREAGREYGQHAIVRAFYYDTLSKRERQALHRRAGAYYELVDNQENDTFKAALHFERAEKYAHAADLAVDNVWTIINQGQTRALSNLLDRFSAQQLDVDRWVRVCSTRGEVATLLMETQLARASFEEALVCLNNLPDIPALRERKAAVYRGLARIGERTGDYEQAERACRAGLALVERLDLPNIEIARLRAQLAEVLWRRSQYDAAEQVCREGLVALPPKPAAPRERATLLFRIATIHSFRGQYTEAIGGLEQSLKLSRVTDDLALTAAILHNLGRTLFHAGQWNDALRSYDESIRLKELIGDIAGRASTLNNMGVIYMNRGDYPTALDRFVAAHTVCKRFNLPEPLAWTIVNIGIVHFIQGQLEKAAANLERAKSIFESLDNEYGVADCLYRLGDVELARRSPGAAQDYAEQALALARRINSAAHESCAMRVLGEATLAQDRADEAATLLERSWQIQKQVGDSYDQVLILMALARLALAQGDRTQATAYANEGLALAREQQVPYLITMAERVLAELDEGLHQPVLNG